jgi:outer membrane protein OmpA-like peptidoglycan-associated protein
MRSLLAAFVLLCAVAPAYAQETPPNSGPNGNGGPDTPAGARAETDRAEQELRTRLAPAGVAVDRVAPDEIRLTMADAITFAFDRAYVSPKFKPHLADLARTLRDHPSMAVSIVGHTDAIGSDAYNQDLSERRAEAVSEVLRDDDVAYNRIIASGMGETEPIATNATEEGRARNRRVEITLKTKAVGEDR